MLHNAGTNNITTLWQRLLAVFVSACLFLSLVRYFAGNFSALAATMLVFPIACMFAGVVLCNTDIRKRPEFWVFIALVALTFVSSALNEKFYGVFSENAGYLGTLTVSLFACYALSFATPKESRTSVLHVCIGVSATVVTVVCAWGLVLAASGTYFMPRFLPEYGIGLCPPSIGMGADYRLVAFSHPNMVGIACEIVVLLGMYRILTAKKAAVRVAYAVSAVVCYVAAAAAASRTTSLAVSVGLAMIAFRLLYMRASFRKRAVRWCVAILVAAAVAVGSFLLMDAIYDGLLSLSPVGRSEAAAITDAERVIADETSAFSGRTNIWSGVLQCMQDTPRLFLLGTSPVQVGQVIAPYTPIWVQEVHSSYMQMLISCGVLCPLLFAVYVVLLAVKGIRTYFAAPQDGVSDVGYLVPVLVAILISGCMETFLLLYPQLHFGSLWFFIASGYLFCMGVSRQKPFRNI